MDNALSVQQLNAYVHNTIAESPLLRNVTVYGEISSFKLSGPHGYFTLKDENAQIACNLFYARKTYNPTKDGEAVLVTGSVDYYAKNGKLSLNVTTIQPVGKGALHVKLEELKKKLLLEGLFDTAHKKAIPAFCKKVCVVTSRTGAVIRDIVRTVRNKNALLDIYLYDVRVQGDSAAGEIVEALSIVDEMRFDCLVLARGGGSFEDLMPFNDEALARRIYSLRTPIVSAIGHETDFSISDLVADARAATPTAAAELVAFNEEDVRLAVLGYLAEINTQVKRAEERGLSRVRAGVQSLHDKSLRKIEGAEAEVRLSLERLSAKEDRVLDLKQRQVEKQITLLEAANPAKLLKNGYFRVFSGGKSFHVNTAKEGDELTVYDMDGSARCKVLEINKK